MVVAILSGGIARTAVLPPTDQPGDPSATPEAARSSPPIPSIPPIPPVDVPGLDVAGLERFPGSVRVDFRADIQGDLRVTEVEYLVVADLEDVRIFYRSVFDANGWLVGDDQYRSSEWTFFVIDAPREAIVELEWRKPVIEIEITLTEPVGPASAPPATNRPVPPPTAAPPPPDDDDGDEGSDDDAGGD